MTDAFDKQPPPSGVEESTTTEAGVDKDLEELGGTRPPEMRLPEGFCLNEKGIVCATIRAKKLQPVRLLPLLMTGIKDPVLQFRSGHFGIGFTASLGVNGMTEVFLSSVNVYKPGLELAKRGVMPCPGYGAKERLKQFMVEWFRKLLNEDTVTHDVESDMNSTTE